jgi:hypothetical protein
LHQRLVDDLRQNHSWYNRLLHKFPLHPCVRKMLKDHRPKDYAQLALEHPYISEKDPARLAYTRSVGDGQNDRQLVTSIGKYLAKHWPHVSDHIRRDVQMLHTPDKMYFVNTIPEMIRACEMGPRSCMQSSYGSIPFQHDYEHRVMNEWFADPQIQPPDWNLHPYAGYNPAYGWHMAVRENSDKRFDGRALLLNHKDKKFYVRTYRRNPHDEISGWSETDFTLNSWLGDQGYIKLSSWPDGAKLDTPLAARGHGYIRMPYLDGDYHWVISQGNGTSVVTQSSSEATHECCNTNGTASEYSDDSDDSDDDYHFYCEDCEERTHEDERYCVGRHEDRYVCNGCYEHYSEVRGAPFSSTRDYSEYYCHHDDCAEIERHGYEIDTNYLPNNVVRLESSRGDTLWAEMDDCVCIDDEWYLDDDKRVVALQEECPITGDRYALKDDAYDSGEHGWWASEDHYREHHPAEVEETEEST